MLSDVQKFQLLNKQTLPCLSTYIFKARMQSKQDIQKYKWACDANLKPIYSSISPRISGQDPIIWVQLRLSILKWLSIQYLGTVAINQRPYIKAFVLEDLSKKSATFELVWILLKEKIINAIMCRSINGVRSFGLS